MPNAKVLESKKTIVDALSEKIQNSTSAVFVDYKGITVAQDTALRNQFREANVEYAVVKNTLTRFAANKAGYTEFDELLNGADGETCHEADSEDQGYEFLHVLHSEFSFFVLLVLNGDMDDGPGNTQDCAGVRI